MLSDGNLAATFGRQNGQHGYGDKLTTRKPSNIVLQPNITAGGTPYIHCSAQREKTFLNRPVEITKDFVVSANTQMLGALNVAGQLTISDENFNMAFHV